MATNLVVYDTTETGYPFLSTFWAAGSLVNKAKDLPCSSWGQAYSKIKAAIPLRHPSQDPPVVNLEVWSHGNDGVSLINGQTVDLAKLAAALGRIDPASTVWFRSCETFRGRDGKAFAKEARDTLGCVVVGHTKVISWPNPLFQRSICALRQDEEPWWTDFGNELRGCSTLRMEVPPWAFRA